MKRINEYFSNSLIYDTINLEEPGKYLIHYIINLGPRYKKMINMVKINFSLYLSFIELCIIYYYIHIICTRVAL